MTLVLIVGESIYQWVPYSFQRRGRRSSADQLGPSLYAACLLGIGTGLLCGSMNGILVAYLSLPSFIVTLGMLEMARGLAQIGVSEPAKRLITGGVIIIAVFLDSWRIRRGKAT